MFVKVIVTPNAKKEKIEQMSDTQFEVAVREPAERNLANHRVVSIIARQFKILPGKVRIISGHRSHSKMLSIET